MTVENSRIAPVTDLVGRFAAVAADPGYGPDSAAAFLEDALAYPGVGLDPRHQHRPADRDWMLYPLFRAADRRASMLVVVFGPGVRAPVHNHGAWAVIGIVHGRERETWFRRTDDGGVPGTARLEEERSFVNATGSVHVVPDGIIHTVEALDGVDAVSIHLYGTDIVTQDRSEFDMATGRVQPYRPPVSDAATD